LVCAFRPCVVAEFAWMWNRVEGPDQLSGDDVERAEIARRRAVRFADDRTGEKQVLEHSPGGAARPPERTQIADTHVDAAVVAEAGHHLARARVDLAERGADAENQAPIRSIGALPVIHS